MRISGILVFLFLGSQTYAATNPVVVGSARFTVLSPEVIRTEYQAQGHFIDLPSLFAASRDTSFTDFTVRQTPNGVTIETSRVTLIYLNDGRAFHSGNLHAMVRFSDGREAEWNFGMTNAGNLGGTRNSLDYVDPSTAKLSDGVLSRDGWYWLDDSRRFLLDEHGWVRNRPADAGMDGFLFGYGDDYKAGLRALTRAGGRVPLPRRYTLGAWYSRWWPYSSEDYRDIVGEFRDHHFPLDMLVMDMDWHKDDGWTGLSWNRNLLPDAEDLLRELHADRIHVTLNDHPQEGVKPIEDAYDQFMADMGESTATRYTIPYDAGDEKYLTTLFRDTHTPLEKEGVDFWWLDWMGDEKPFDKLDWVNEYYYRHSAETGLRGQSFSRWADWGDHRHPIHFSGDTRIEWPTLAYEIPFTATAGNIGAFYWSHDLGGFIGDRNPEILARWTQFGATSAAMRLHSANHSDIDKRPWTYEKDVEDSMRVAFHLRAELMPYVYSTAWEAYRESLPLDRPLYLEYPNLDEAYRNPQEYLFGDAFLTAPITTPGTGPEHLASQNVYFPPGRWFDWFTGHEFAAGTHATLTEPLDRFPLFAKGGVPILMQPYVDRPATEPLNTVVIRTFPGVDGVAGRATLYEDDGETQGYLRNEFRETLVTYIKFRSGVTVQIEPAAGDFPGSLAKRAFIVELAQVDRPANVRIDGQATSLEYDQAARTARILVPDRVASQGAVVDFEF